MDCASGFSGWGWGTALILSRSPVAASLPVFKPQTNTTKGTEGGGETR